jgi:hypothetical protein
MHMEIPPASSNNLEHRSRRHFGIFVAFAGMLGRTGELMEEERVRAPIRAAHHATRPLPLGTRPLLSQQIPIPWGGILGGEFNGKEKHLAFRRPDAKTAAISTAPGPGPSLIFQRLGADEGRKARATIGKQGPATTPKTPAMVGALFRRFGSFRKRISNTGSTESNTTWRDDHDSR